MSEMIDRVAHCIAATTTDDPWERIDENDQKQFLAYARAAIAAMEQPTQKMIEAGQDVRRYDGLEEMDSFGPPAEVWKAMVTAELKPD